MNGALHGFFATKMLELATVPAEPSWRNVIATIVIEPAATYVSDRH